jgi:hypothetical protein
MQLRRPLSARRPIRRSRLLSAHAVAVADISAVAILSLAGRTYLSAADGFRSQAVYPDPRKRTVAFVRSDNLVDRSLFIPWLFSKTQRLCRSLTRPVPHTWRCPPHLNSHSKSCIVRIPYFPLG